MGTPLPHPDRLDRSLYDRDFYTWTRDQAAALRQAAADRVNAPIDWEHVAEEIEDLGKAARREVRSYLDQTLRHLLLLQLARSREPRAHWRDEVHEFRGRLQDTLEDNPGLKPQLPELKDRAWQRAKDRVRKKLTEFGDGDPDAVPEDCPYTLDQILGDWLPPDPERDDD